MPIIDIMIFKIVKNILRTGRLKVIFSLGVGAVLASILFKNKLVSLTDKLHSLGAK